MTGYIVLFAFLFLCSSMKNKERMLKIDFVILTIFSSIRFGIGYDYYAYLDMATNMSHVSENTDPIPKLMADFSRSTFPLLFFVFSSCFISFFYYKGIKRFGTDYFLSVLFYVCFPLFFMDQLGIIRQGMASSVIFYAMSFRGNNKLFIVILLIIAFMCHNSAIVGFFLLLPWNRFSLRQLWMMFFSSFMVGIIVVRLILILLNVLTESDFTDKADGYLNTVGQNEDGNKMVLLVYIVAAFCLFNYNKIVRANPKYSYFLGMVVLGVSMMSLFSFNGVISKRLCVFFFSATIFVVPQLIKILNIPRQVYYTTCILLFSLLVYIGSSNSRPEDPSGYGVTYPYRTIFDFI